MPDGMGTGIKPFIDAPGKPDPKNVTVTIDNGMVTLELGSTKPEPRTKQRSKTEEFNVNLAEELDPTALASLAAHLIEEIEADIEERSDWEDTANQAADYLGIKLTDPATTVAEDGTICQAVATCMLEAAIKLWSTAYAELLPAGGPVKAERIDIPAAILSGAAVGAGAAPGGGGLSASVPPGPANGLGAPHDSEPGQAPVTQGDAAGDDLADALEKDLNWYLTKGDRGYYPDFSKMLMSRGLIGNAYREVYHCPIKRMPISRWVMAQDLIVSGDPASLDEPGGRVTARKKVAQSVMRRMMQSGEYLDVPLVAPTGQTSKTEIMVANTQGTTPTPTLPRDFKHTVYEVNCELGSTSSHDLYGSLEILDHDEAGKEPGYPLPYRVTIDLDSRQVLAIRRNWKKGDKQHRWRRRFVKYGFIPGFGFYDLGLIHIVGNPTQAATMIQRAAVDSAMLSNFPAWVRTKGPGAKQETTVYRPGAGEVVTIDTVGQQKIGDVIMPWPYKPPSGEAMALSTKLEGDVKSLAGVIDIPVGEGRIGNTPVGTIMSYIESVSMVPGAVHKADHSAQAEEFDLLRELIAEDPKVLTRGNKSPARKWQIGQEVLTPDISPQADPNTPSQIHRLLKIQGMISMGGLPQFAMDQQGPIANNREIYKRAAEVLMGVDIDRYAYPPQPPSAAPPPPPDPRIVAAQIKAQSEQEKGQLKQQEIVADHAAKMQELSVTSDDKERDRQAANAREAMKVHADRVSTGADMVTAAAGHGHDEAMQGQDRQHQAGMQQADHAQATQQQLTAPLIAPAEGKSDA